MTPSSMTPGDPVALLEHGLATSWSRQLRWVPNSSIRHLGGILVALSGLADQTQQVALVEGPVDDPEASVVAAEVCFDRAGWRPAFCLVSGAHPDIEAVLAERGFRVVQREPGMVRSLVDRDWPRPVLDRAVLELGVSIDRDQVVEVQRQAFGFSVATAAGMLPDAMFADPDVALIVARSEPGGPVIGSITVHLDPEAAAVTGTAVSPGHRHLGVGTALTVAALELAAAHRIPAAWLQASPEGERVYTRVGFQAMAVCEVWLR
jgi:ribosomal protein S18 acetylase RimI-like enzyme